MQLGPHLNAAPWFCYFACPYASYPVFSSVYVVKLYIEKKGEVHEK